MLEWLVRGQVINITIIVMSMIGFLSLSVAGIIYSSLVKASEDMAFTESALLKQIKLKYANCYKLELYTHQVQAFINRYLYKKRILKIPLYLWEHLGLEMMYISMILGLLGTFVNITYYQQNDLAPLSNAFLTGVLGFALATGLLIFKTVYALETKKHIFYSNVMDYLENILRNKLEQQNKKEGANKEYEEMDPLEEKNTKSKEKQLNNKKNNKVFNKNSNNIPIIKQREKFKKPSKNPIVEEDFIEDIINELMS